MRFLDTNVILYSVSEVPDESTKRGVAERILDDSDLCLSTQVLAEFYTQATRATAKHPLFHHDAADVAEGLTRYPIQPVTISVFLAALALRVRFGISYWDAAIIEAARAIGADTVLTEDLQDGQDFDGVRVVNPFR
ncbi:MAG: PIN domain-containing protein [Sporichthyaceae bacterium]